jgi:hypothetical protein
VLAFSPTVLHKPRRFILKEEFATVVVQTQFKYLRNGSPKGILKPSLGEVIVFASLLPISLITWSAKT